MPTSPFVGLPAGFPAAAGTARDAAILGAVRTGEVTCNWSLVTSAQNGHTGTFRVCTDGVKLGGVRLVGSAYLCQHVADSMSATLPTPRLNDLAWQQAQVVIAPQTIYPPTNDTATMVKESTLVDTAVASRAGLVAPIGKPWSLAKAATPTKAVLYGWQSATPIAGVPLYPSPATPGVRVIQPLSTAHDPHYVDYSSSIWLVARECIIDGQPRDLFDVLRDPSLAPLASHEGALVNVRQPGVPVLPAVSSPSVVSTGSTVASIWPETFQSESGNGPVVTTGSGRAGRIALWSASLVAVGMMGTLALGKNS